MTSPSLTSTRFYGKNFLNLDIYIRHELSYVPQIVINYVEFILILISPFKNPVSTFIIYQIYQFVIFASFFLRI